LHADPPAVNNSDSGKAQGLGFLEVRFHSGFNIARCERVQIENVCNLNHYWFLIFVHP